MPSSFSISRSGRGSARASSCSRAAIARSRSGCPDDSWRRCPTRRSRCWATTTTRRSICARRPRSRAAPSTSAPDLAALTAQFEGQGAIAVDDLLTPQALDSLRRFLLESTIWHDFSHIDGFVASYLEDGLACPLLLQIADELRRAFPDILGQHPLSQAWAFKGLRPQSAVDVHADDAAVSVNFWVTPTEANLDPARGGLVVSLTPPPDDWEIKDYDADQERIVTFLGKNAEE